MLYYPVKNDLERIKFAREAAEVDRAHTTHFIGEYNVGLHSHNMLSMLRILWKDAPVILIWAIHEHDLTERLSGDIPSPSKWAGIINHGLLHKYEVFINEIIYGSDSNSELTKEEKGWLKGLDMLELFCWTKDQFIMGNKNVTGMNKRIWKSFKTNQHLFPIQIIDMFHFINKSEWTQMPELGD